jgi:hypothetical protein
MSAVIFIGGFAQAGKSTAMGILEKEFNLPCFSTSQFLEGITEDCFNFFSDEYFWHEMNKETQRQAKIHMAEKILIPRLGREKAIVAPVISLALEELARKKGIVVVETIGGEEHRLMQSILFGECWSILQDNVNIRRKSELPGVDIRELLAPATDIQNDGTKEELTDSLWEFIEHVRGI